jgi:hypothetical protein
MFLRNMELGMAAALGGGLATAIALPLRLHVPPAVKPFLVAGPLGVTAIIQLVFFMLRRSPPNEAIERFARAIEVKRRLGASVAPASRPFILGMGFLAFVFSLLLAMVLPIQ